MICDNMGYWLISGSSIDNLQINMIKYFVSTIIILIPVLILNVKIDCTIEYASKLAEIKN